MQPPILGTCSRLSGVPTGMTATPDDYAWRFYHVVSKPSRCPMDDGIAILLFHLKAKILSLSRHFLPQLLVGLEKLFLGLELVEWCEVDLGILHIGKLCGK